MTRWMPIQAIGGPVAGEYAEQAGGGDVVELTVTDRLEGHHAVVAVSGEVDVMTAGTLRERLNDLVAAGHHDLVIDLDRVDFLDSAGLGVLVGGLKRVRAEHGSLQLVCTQERILKVFRITRLTEEFTIHPTLAQALATPTGESSADPSGDPLG
jgi:anti-sigma B factor antagonist